jgi:hypothetical protein
MLDGDVEDAVKDVADEPTPPDFEHRRLRVLIERDDDDWTYKTVATDSESVSVSARNLYRALQRIRPQFPGTYEKEAVVLATDDEGTPIKAIMSLVHRRSEETVMDFECRSRFAGIGRTPAMDGGGSEVHHPSSCSSARDRLCGGDCRTSARPRQEPGRMAAGNRSSTRRRQLETMGEERGQRRPISSRQVSS